MSELFSVYSFAILSFAFWIWVLICNTRCFYMQEKWIDKIHKHNINKIYARRPDDELLDYDEAKPRYEKCLWLLITFRDPRKLLSKEIRN